MLMLMLTILGAPLPRASADTNFRRHAGAHTAATATAHRVGQAPALNGRLDDPAWAQAAPVTGFVQSDPTEGAAVSESTEVRIVYDADALYVGARLFDRTPGGIVRRLARRDASTHSDEFRVFVDSYHDHRTAFEFIVNPAGVKKDVLIGDDGDFSDTGWDPVWEAATSVDDRGWTAEIRIPFSELRFPRAAEQVWGVRLERWIERKNERAMFPFVAKTESGLASRFAHLTGLREIGGPRRLAVLPYAVGRGTYHRPTRQNNPFDNGAIRYGSAGADFKYGVSPSLTLDATVNPDFGQVELDQAFVNLTEFEQFLDEHRPFFVEGSQIFEFGGNGGGVNRFSDTPLFFYSRRIGRPPQGEPVSKGDFEDVPGSTTILGAGKLSGRTPGGWSVGLLDAVTSRERATVADTTTGERFRDEVEPFSNYFAGRVKRDARGGNTSIGMIATAMNRWAATSALADLPTSAWAGGLDFFQRWGNNTYTLAGSVGGSLLYGDSLAIKQAQRSSNRYFQRPDATSFHYDPGRTSLSGYTGDLYLSKVAGNWRWGLAGRATSPGFEVNDLGFQKRVDRVSAGAAFGRRWTRPGRTFRSANAYLTYQPSWNYDGDLIERTVGAFGYLQYKNYWSSNWALKLGGRAVDDRLTRGGPAAMKPASWYGSADLSTDGRKQVSGYGFVSYDRDEAGSWTVNLLPQVTWRPGAATSVSLSLGYLEGHQAAQSVTRAADTTATETLGTRYVFAELRQRELYTTLRLNATLSPALSFQLYAQPFTFAGDYEGFKELRAPRTFAFNTYGRDNGSTISRTDATYSVDPDGPGPAGTFSFTNPDFRTRSLKLNAVVRWEYRPGSTLFLVWTQSRASYVPNDARVDLFPDLWSGVFRDRPTNVFLVKVNYWINF